MKPPFQLIERCLGLFQTGDVETLGEPTKGALELAVFLCGDGGWL